MKVLLQITRTTVLPLTFVAQLCIPVAGQDLVSLSGSVLTGVNLAQGQEKLLKDALREMETRFGVSFVCKGDLLERKVVHYDNAGPGKLERILGELLEPVNLRFKKVANNIYVILPQQQPESQARPLGEASSSTAFTPFVLSLPPAISQGGQAAAINLSGRVTSSENNEGLPGVNILIKGTTIGTTTDSEGRYSLTVPDGNERGILVFSFIGYTSEEVPIDNRSVINVALVSDIKSLTEVVVVGYGTQKKETATGSITSVKGAEIVQTPVTNVSNSLAGRLPGLTAVTRSGEPGSDGSTIRIRGVNTLNNNDPLIVVDGIPGRSLDRIDPNSIESITVLKDASAAIYGAQAANGVILITTKRGKTGKPEITINLNQGYGRPTRIPQMTNAAEYATMLNEIDAYRNRTPRYSADDIQKFSDGSDPWRYPDTDWFSEVLKPWSGQNYGNITVSGGSENLRYFLLLGAKSQDGYYRNSATKYTQYDFRSNLDGKISKDVSIAFDLAGRQENRNFPVRSAGSIFRMVMRGKPQMHAYWPDGTPGPDIEYGDNPAVVSTDATGYDRDTWYVLNSNLKLNVNIPWVKGLSLTGNVGVDKGFQLRKKFETPWYLYSWDGQTYGADGQPVLIKGKKGFDDPRLSQNTEFNQNILLNALVNYEKTISNVHNVKVMVGTERRTGNRDLFSAYRRFFVSTAVDQMFAGGDAEKNNSGTAYVNARLNYFGRLNYNFSEKYLAEFVWRYDGSYIFPQNKRYGFFPGVSVGWRISEEGFWKNNISFIDNFKLRGSWGQTGNDRIDEWQYLSTYGYEVNNPNSKELNDPNTKRTWPYIFGVDQENQTMFELRIPNPDVTWEVANQSNIGFETQLFNNRISVEADYFYNRRSMILWKRNASVPTSAGLTLPPQNIGKVANSGFEFNVGYNGDVRDLRYQVSVNGGYAKNEILFWDEAPGAPEWQRSTGSPMNTNLYYNSIGVFNDQAEVDAYPHWPDARPGDVIFENVFDDDGDGELNDPDDKIDARDRVRNPFTTIPRFTGGLSLNMQYKGFDVAVLFQAATGAVRYIQTESGDIGNFLKDFYDNRWTPENPGASGPRTFNRDEEYWRNQQNTHFLHKTDYARLKNVQVGYSLPSALTGKAGMQQVRVYLSGFNLFTFSPDLKDFDPEAENINGQTFNGQGYPLQKVVNAGLTITF